MFTLTFPVRSYECDGYGHVNHANYLRYMQEAAFSASAAAGYDTHTLTQMGLVWVTRMHDIEFLRPLTYGDTLTLTTWVASFRRVQSLRRYNFFRGEELVARASTRWVLIDLEKRKPATVPVEMTQAFCPDGYTQDSAVFPAFPTPAPPALDLLPQRRIVEWRDIDRQRHVNNAVYLSYMEDGIIQACGRLGWPVSRMTAAGFSIFARRYQIEYHHSAVLGDELETTTWVSDKKRSTAVRHYAIHRLPERELIARGRALWVWVDIETGRPIRIPVEFIASFQKIFRREKHRS